MRDFFEELKRRHIYRIAVGYAVVAWLLLQLFNNLTPLLKVPDWTGTLVLILLIGGFPIALILGWSVDLKSASTGQGMALRAAGPLAAGASGHFSESPARTLPSERAGVPVPAGPGDGPAVPLPEGPSLVVLPFANMSGESDQDFFADGLTEDIITDLSRFRHLFIISRNSAFRYKGKAADVREVARELNVHYVVEGSVRKAGGRVRVTVQLIDGRTNCHVWAERYDRELADIFAIQDEVTMAIVATLPGRLEAASSERIGRKPTGNMTAYECVLAGKLLHHRSNAADNAKALQLLNRAIALDPNYAQAHAWKACTLGQSWVNGYCTNREAAMAESLSELQTALRLDANDSDVHRILAAVHLTSGNHDKSIYHQQRALTLNPNDDLIVVQQGEILTWLGEPENGIPWIEKAMRLNPYHPERYWYHLARACFVARRYADAIAALAHIAAPEVAHHSYLAACHAELGDAIAARQHVAEVLKRDPGFSIEGFLRTLHYKREEDIAHHRAALVRAGLPLSPAGVVAMQTSAEGLSCQ